MARMARAAALTRAERLWATPCGEVVGARSLISGRPCHRPSPPPPAMADAPARPSLPPALQPSPPAREERVTVPAATGSLGQKVLAHSPGVLSVSWEPGQEGKDTVSGMNSGELGPAGKGTEESSVPGSLSRGELGTGQGGRRPVSRVRRGNRFLGCRRAGDFGLAACLGGGQKARALLPQALQPRVLGTGPRPLLRGGLHGPWGWRGAAAPLRQPRRSLLLLPPAAESG